MSPKEPSVNAGQKTGMSFYAKQSLSAGSVQTRKTSIHFVRPVIYRFLVVDLLPQPPDEGARRPHLPGLLLLRKHGVQDGRQPVLELAVVVVRDDEVADAVHAPFPQFRAIHVEVSQVGFAEALDEVFLDPSRGGHERANMLMLDEVEDDLPQPRGDEVGCVAQEDVALRLRADLRGAVLFGFVFGDRLVRESPFALCIVLDVGPREIATLRRTILFTISMAFPRLLA